MSIPISSIVTVNPATVSAAGQSIALNAVVLTKGILCPRNRVIEFNSAQEVRDFFYPVGSGETEVADVYFSGFDNSTIKPTKIIYSYYTEIARAAELKGARFTDLPLAYVQTLSGTLSVTVNGVLFTSASVNLSGATSLTNAASIINAAFTGAGKPSFAYDANIKSFYLTSPTTGAASTIGYCAAGTLADGLKVSQSTGAEIFQGLDADTPAAAMARVKSFTQNWASFMTAWEPDLTNKQLFAAWATSQNSRFVYVCHDSDPYALTTGSPALNTMGKLAKVSQTDGVACVYGSANLAAFVCGTIASIDFSRTNGRITFAFKSQSGFKLKPTFGYFGASTITTEADANNLKANGYSFYGEYATANDQFSYFYDGNLPGKWKFLDSLVNEIYMNSEFQLSLTNLLTTVGAVSYNEAGYTLIRAALADPINSAVNFGAIRQGVALSSAQKVEVNQSAGVDAATQIEKQGYYLQVKDPGATARGNRATPVINFWYADGGAVHKITMASIDLL